jgi:two-component system response regulator DegU
VLILDIGMPKLSGIEVAARAHKMDRPPGVIILSVHGDESYIMRALAAGARAYLLKSATDEDLIPAVRAVARESRSSVRPSPPCSLKTTSVGCSSAD